MPAIYHVFGSGDFFLETISQREAALAAQDVANETGLHWPLRTSQTKPDSLRR